MEDKFKEAQWKVLHLKNRPSGDDLLLLYGLFKQASFGDVHGDEPGIFDIMKRAKYEAWEQQKGRPQEEAMKEYVELVEKLVEKDA